MSNSTTNMASKCFRNSRIIIERCNPADLSVKSRLRVRRFHATRWQQAEEVLATGDSAEAQSARKTATAEKAAVQAGRKPDQRPSRAKESDQAIIKPRALPSNQSPPKQQSTLSSRSPRPLSRREFLNNGDSTSTIAGGAFEAVLRDKLHALANKLPGNDIRKRPVKDQVADVIKQAQEQWAHRNEENEAAIGVDTKAGEKAVQEIVSRMVVGKYDADALLNGQDKYKQPLLNDIARALTKNPTYLAADANRVLEKVRGLLPATQPAKPERIQKAAK